MRFGALFFEDTSPLYTEDQVKLDTVKATLPTACVFPECYRVTVASERLGHGVNVTIKSNQIME